ncbi:TolB family protein [Xylanibacter ruminicola]|uniref:TolB family protein n=1 Tax=Xylanibacter ruminicola TaxID=839 RepID=UPI0004907D22|nr:PD40 domain-containing protein [Xylanibacter ruminicola]
MNKIGYWLMGVGCWLMASCASTPEQVSKVNQLPDIYPDYIGVTIPADIAPLNFNLADEDIDCMDVVARGSKGGELHTNGDWADFDIADWQALTQQNQGGKITLTVCVEKDGQWTQYNDFDIYVSKDNIDEWGLTYRRIKPGYEVGGDIGIYQRNLSNFDETAILAETVVPGRCFNCHTANRTNPNRITLQMRGEGGGTMIQKDGKQAWVETKTDSTKAAGSYSYWHPQGDYVAMAVNSVHQSFFTGTGQRIEVYHKFSNVEVLDTRTNELILSPLLQTEDLEIFPAFSHDGKWLYYSTSKPCKVPAEYEKVKCSICRIGFDAEKGQFGLQVDTLLNGPATDKSYVLARPSYDGRWLMYCVSSRGNFPVSQDDADLWLMDLKTGKTRALTEVNSQQCEAYHNWSDNSRWFVFSSKCEDGMYTKLYLACIDEQGRVSKPFLLPQRNPRKYYQELMDAYNVPDFTKTKVELDAHEAYRQVFDNKREQVKIK